MKPEKVHEKFCPILANFSGPIKVCRNIQKGDTRCKTHIHIQEKREKRGILGNYIKIRIEIFLFSQITIWNSRRWTARCAPWCHCGSEWGCLHIDATGYYVGTSLSLSLGIVSMIYIGIEGWLLKIRELTAIFTSNHLNINKLTINLSKALWFGIWLK